MLQMLGWEGAAVCGFSYCEAARRPKHGHCQYRWLDAEETAAVLAWVACYQEEECQHGESSQSSVAFCLLLFFVWLVGHHEELRRGCFRWTRLELASSPRGCEVGGRGAAAWWLAEARSRNLSAPKASCPLGGFQFLDITWFPPVRFFAWLWIDHFNSRFDCD